ncbi:MAG: hypothetical protein JWP52_2879 [Rhizobacter sp.]|jgi:hypothetical protein|nr:hypothetical protein [Rhizobacter sp.]
MSRNWRTAWQGQHIVVFRGDEEFDRVDSQNIERVMFVHRGPGDSPGDLAYAVIELQDEVLMFSPDTGISGRVLFERQQFWAERGCVFWVSEHMAPLPMRHRRGLWFLRRALPAFERLPRGELASSIDQWPMEGPQTWEQRKWLRIARNRPFAKAVDDKAVAPVPSHAGVRR